MKTLIAAAVFGVMFISCDKDRGECVEESCFDAVPLYYQPVCGCDGITYPNSCYAATFNGVTSYINGACN